MPDNGISSIVDNIVLLTFVELGDRMRRAMLVAKARGSDHALATREYTIGAGGFTVLPEGPEMLPMASFRSYLGLLSRAPTRVDTDTTQRRRKSDVPVNE
jgi:KaiC/GvpD/RAD55 family RecA-like ATPase